MLFKHVSRFISIMGRCKSRGPRVWEIFFILLLTVSFMLINKIKDENERCHNSGISNLENLRGKLMFIA